MVKGEGRGGWEQLPPLNGAREWILRAVVHTIPSSAALRRSSSSTVIKQTTLSIIQQQEGGLGRGNYVRDKRSKGKMRCTGKAGLNSHLTPHMPSHLGGSPWVLV